MKGIEMSSEKQASNNKPMTEEIKTFVEKKEQQTNSLPEVEDKYQEVANVKYIKDKQARLDVFAIIDEISKFEQCNLVKTSDHDLSVRVRGKQVVRLCPLKKGWSASIRGEKIQKYTKDGLLSKVKEAMEEEMPKTQKQDDNGIITKLEERINQMSKDSKGISINGIKLTKEIKNWAKEHGYLLTGETLLVN